MTFEPVPTRVRIEGLEEIEVGDNARLAPRHRVEHRLEVEGHLELEATSRSKTAAKSNARR